MSSHSHGHTRRRCALGWAVLDQRNLTNVLARAEAPLVHAELPWEVHGFTPLVVYTDGVRGRWVGAW